MSEPTSRRKRSNDNEKTPGGGMKASPRWWAPVMVTLMVVGLLWAVVFYLTNQEYPIPDIGTWNLGIAFGIIMLGFGMTTRWR